ncbi:MAG: DUF2971 domain-containing protein [Acidiferrobacteraceae bacterium]
MSNDEPKKLYRYFPLGPDNETWGNRMRDTLEQHHLYWPLRSQLNDPFDCAVKLETRDGDNSDREAGIQGRVDKQAGILSFSKRNDHVLMWSHYANSHRGMCLEFDMEQWTRTERERQDCYLASVEYRMERPLLALSRQELAATETLKRIAFTKHQDWGYEEEWRMVCSFRNRCNPYYLEFPVAALTGVIFGLKISDNDRCTMEQVIRDANYTLTISEAREDHDQFRVEIHPCPERE